MTEYLYATPEWLAGNAEGYAANGELRKRLKKLSAKMGFAVTADPAFGLDEDLFFVTFIEAGRIEKMAFVPEAEAKKDCLYILAAPPDEWGQVLRKKFKFIARFMMQKIQLTHGEKVDVLKLAPLANDLVEAMNQVPVRYPDEMTPEELESYRRRVGEFRAELGV